MNLSPPGRDRSRSSVRSLRLLSSVALCLLALPLVLQAAAPGWWSERGVVDASRSANDFAAVNQGQVKNLAKQAMQELEDHLPGGAGLTVQHKVEEWALPTAVANDYSPVKLGALKALAQPFYARLIEVGYTDAFPWTGKEAQANNYAAANIGQAKNLFAFDVTADADHNGLPDWWERRWFGHTGIDPAAMVSWGPVTVLRAFQQGLNPLDFYDGSHPALKISGSDQTGSPGQFVPLPLFVKVTDLASGASIPGAPVTFTVTQGGGQVQKSSSGTASTSLTVLADATGQGKVVFLLPNANNATCLISVTAGNMAPSESPVFTEHSDDGTGSFGHPFSPTNVVGYRNPDGSEDLTWENNTDDQTPVVIYREQSDDTWSPLITLPPGTTAYHIPAP